MTRSINFTDYDKSRKVSSPRRAHASNGNSPSYNHHRQVLAKFHPSSSGDIRASNRQVPRTDSSTYFSQNGNVGQRHNVNFRIADILFTDKINPFHFDRL